MNLYINYINIKNDSYLLVVKYKLKQVIKLGIKEQIDTITNRYTCSIFQVAKITKKGVWLCSLFVKTIFRLIIDEVCIISTRYSVSFS